MTGRYNGDDSEIPAEKFEKYAKAKCNEKRRNSDNLFRAKCGFLS